MDPRLSPSLTPHPQNNAPAPARPVAQAPAPQLPAQQPTPAPQVQHQPAPANQAAADQANPIDQPMVTQVVAAFPVKQEEGINGLVQANAAPASSHEGQNPDAPPQPQDDLDKILQAVNSKVKTPDTPDDSKKKTGKKFLSKSAQTKDNTRRTRPIGPAIVVLVVALMLSATAIFAYREGNRTATATKEASKVGTSYTASSSIQEAGGTLVNPSDLDDYAQTLQTKLNSLNDSQDFTTNSLGDKVLGL